MSLVQQDWIITTADAAQQAGHIFPEMAACEAALESAFGQSQLAREGKNLFGTKLHGHPVIGSLRLPTKEFTNDEWVVVSADWMDYASFAECFSDRMATLSRLAPYYPNYQLALTAGNAIDYVTAVSKTWATDPERAAKCIAIYNQYCVPQVTPAVLDASDN